MRFGIWMAYSLILCLSNVVVYAKNKKRHYSNQNEPVIEVNNDDSKVIVEKNITEVNTALKELISTYAKLKKIYSTQDSFEEENFEKIASTTSERPTRSAKLPTQMFFVGDTDDESYVQSEPEDEKTKKEPKKAVSEEATDPKIKFDDNLDDNDPLISQPLKLQPEAVSEPIEFELKKPQAKHKPEPIPISKSKPVDPKLHYKPSRQKQTEDKKSQSLSEESREESKQGSDYIHRQYKIKSEETMIMEDQDTGVTNAMKKNHKKVKKFRTGQKNDGNTEVLNQGNNNINLIKNFQTLNPDFLTPSLPEILDLEKLRKLSEIKRQVSSPLPNQHRKDNTVEDENDKDDQASSSVLEYNEKKTNEDGIKMALQNDKDELEKSESTGDSEESVSKESSESSATKESRAAIFRAGANNEIKKIIYKIRDKDRPFNPYLAGKARTIAYRAVSRERKRKRKQSTKRSTQRLQTMQDKQMKPKDDLRSGHESKNKDTVTHEPSIYVKMTDKIHPSMRATSDIPRDKSIKNIQKSIKSNNATKPVYLVLFNDKAFNEFLSKYEAKVVEKKNES